MKKLLVVLLSIFIITGCYYGNSPTSLVEDLFMKYQKFDKDISKEVDKILLEQDLSVDNYNKYYKILERQYKNISYEIKDELIDGDKAIVLVEIEVLDYKKSISNLSFDSSIYTKEEYDREKLDILDKVKDKVKYTLEINLTKDKDNNWKINPLTEEQTKKIQGMY